MLSRKWKDRQEAVEKKLLPLIDAAIDKLKSDDGKAYEAMNFIRKECQFEMTLIGTRVTWMLAAQAFLVAGCVLAISNGVNDRSLHRATLCLIASLICLVGGIISYRTIHALDLAGWTIELWHKRVLRVIESTEASPGPWHSVVLGRWRDPNDTVRKESLVLAQWLPWVFIVFWCLLLVLSGWRFVHEIRIFLGRTP